MTGPSREEVISRLQTVIDPCSAATGASLSIVEMGMVENVNIEAGTVVVDLRMTSPLCHALPYFEMSIERVLAGVPGVHAVKCTFDEGGNWQPDNMTGGARQRLANRRELVRGRVDGLAKTRAAARASSAPTADPSSTPT
jgi:metal-sulfur cluster biosynthetic enzyme